MASMASSVDKLRVLLLLNYSQLSCGCCLAKILNNGELLTLSLDKASGSGFQTKNECMFGRSICCSSFVLGNSTGTVTAYYLCSKGSDWDEIDFKFLGNQSGDPCIFHSNVFSQRKGNRASSFVSGKSNNEAVKTFTKLSNFPDKGAFQKPCK
ncbi:hypothetical protein CDL15_Pgr010555 [Punica granatum]|uniref:GH16 domain-containing protein n=1 Tax=Punica granatum TaxID=22663 RepID=A0A218XWW1_PUNGR|nr:hypothetical protein CDL15_Pgr010555 [Punica granatum]